jgi:anti-sigma B factor antagonist
MPHTLVGSGSETGRTVSASSMFGCTVRDGGLDAAWIRVVGELDIATAPQLAQTLRQAQTRTRRVVLDLRQLTFTDSCGVHLILDANIRAKESARRLVLVRGPSQVDRALTLTGASEVLEIVDLEPLAPPVQALVQLAQATGRMNDLVPTGADSTAARCPFSVLTRQSRRSDDRSIPPGQGCAFVRFDVRPCGFRLPRFVCSWTDVGPDAACVSVTSTIPLAPPSSASIRLAR